MVFQNRKRRNRTQPKQSTAKIITDLPDELLLAILERTPDISDVLRLRATSRALMPACSSTVRDRLKVLYIHPSPSSVRRAIRISQSDLGSDIEEISIVNRVLWSEIRRKPDAGFQYTWLRGSSRNIDGELYTDFAGAYKELLDSLVNLTKLKALSFDNRIFKAKPGFNNISLQTVEDWARTVKPTLPSKQLSAENKLYTSQPAVNPQSRFKFTDVDVLASLINRFSTKLTTLRTNAELPCAQAAMLHSGTLANLTRVELRINTGWYKADWQVFSHHILQSAASNLRKLKLHFNYNSAAERRRRIETSLAVVLEGLTFPALQCLELYALFHLVQEFDLGSFILERCRELSVLRTTDVVALPLSYGAHHTGQLVLLDTVMLGIGWEVREADEQAEDAREYRLGA